MMKVIKVNTSKPYNVIVGSGIISHLSDYIGSPCGRKAVVITDSIVWPIYGPDTESQLCAAGFDATHYIFPAGEENKNAHTYFSAVNHLADIHFTRSDLLIALGGGVVGDLTGFIAATYLRGVDYIQIPTTLLAMVDASVGGKTAIDLPAGKNLLGSFYQPDLVLCDIDALSTLPADNFRDGCAEIIKYSILYDPVLFSHLEDTVLNFDREYVISRCIELKQAVVSEDEFDTGVRQKLNFGHTIAHCVETISHFQISHGQAVAVGMAIITKAAASMGICNKIVYQRIWQLLKLYRFHLTAEYASAELYRVALSDKKRNASTVNLIVPKEIGNCMIMPIPVSELQAFIEAGL